MPLVQRDERHFKIYQEIIYLLCVIVEVKYKVNGHFSKLCSENVNALAQSIFVFSFVKNL